MRPPSEPLEHDEGSETDGTSLGFVDTLCCGLGGMIFLFLIFAILPQSGVDEPTDNRIENLLERHKNTKEPQFQPSTDSPLLLRIKVSGKGAGNLEPQSPLSDEKNDWSISRSPINDKECDFLLFTTSPRPIEVNFSQNTGTYLVQVKTLHANQPLPIFELHGEIKKFHLDPQAGFSLNAGSP